MKKLGLWVVVVVAVVVQSSGSLTGEAHASAVRNLAGFTSNTLPANDDGSTGLVSIGFPVNFFGLTFTQLYVNNNGNVTFDASLSSFTPFGLNGTARQIIAPFFADVDTGGSGSSEVRYGTDIVDGRPAFGVNWINVGYYSERSDKLNSFQLILIDRSDLAAGAFDIEFNYDQIQWETGEASSGTNGLGGASVRVGFSNGTGIPGTSFELSGSAVNGALLDSNLSRGLIFNKLNNPLVGRYLFRARGGFILEACANADGLAALVSGLGLPPSRERSLQKSVDIIRRSLQRKNGYAGRKECNVLARRVATLVRVGLVDSSTASGLVGFCAAIGTGGCGGSVTPVVTDTP